ncbi:nipped-B-like protein A [Agrilus planipennis]|uniref:Nipped-B protein n=1 Tax=Agrilus planipennis TaxID=224129 RepID=A0A7F5R8P1_AGRPL|nr:nipped-B-like protein A [Agrilus planipennis]XP_025832338.1 nipped-B-like protein A [Agrilus planipennis]
MEREIPSVPITTLAGVASLTELLPEMPLPTPLPQTLSNKSLLFHPRVAEEAQNLLGTKDEVLIPQLVQSLSQTSSHYIEVKDIYAGLEQQQIEQQENAPELLKAVLTANPSLFTSVTGSQVGQDHSVFVKKEIKQEKPETPSTCSTSFKQEVTPSTCSFKQEVLTVNKEQQTNNEEKHSKDTQTYSGSETLPSDLFLPATDVSQIGELSTQSQQQQMPSRPSVITAQATTQTITQSQVSQSEQSQPKRESSTTEQLRQLRRTTITKEPIEIVIQDEETQTTPTPLTPASAQTNHIKQTTSSSQTTPNTTPTPTPITIKQPVVKLDRISEDDQMLMQISISKFAECRPDLAKELGIVPKQELEDPESEGSQKKNSKLKRRAAGADEDADYIPDEFSALVGSTKRRKTVIKEEKPEPIMVKPKLRRVEKKFVPVLEKLSTEELMETNTYHRFNKSIEHVLKNQEDIDCPEISEDGIVQDEYLLNRVTMKELVTEAAKLKNLGATEMIPTDKLVRLLNVMELNIRGGDRVSPITDEDNESIRQLWMETTMDRVMGAADACLVSLYLMTSSNMPKRVYLEDVIDRVVLYIKYQLHNTIFPSFDSTYRLDNKKKDGRRKKNAQVSEKSILVLYNKMSELINLLAELLSIQVLTDTSVLHASSMGVSPFFVENVSELQLACLKLVTTIFTRYEKHRRLLLDDILASIARLPSTKRSLRTYRLSGDEHIQMLTALVLQLIQCVVALPENITKPDKQSENSHPVDQDVLICNKYEKATTTAGTFLAVFLSKCGSKSEDIDYRPLFENFVQDLLATVNKPEWPATELLLSLLGKMLVKNFSNKGTDMSLRVASLDYLGVVAARLRRDSIVSNCKVDTIDQMIRDIKLEESKDSDEALLKKKKEKLDIEEDRLRFLQGVLLDFLAVSGQTDEAHRHARHFYIAQWYKDATNEKSRVVSEKTNAKENHRSRSRKGINDVDNSDSEDNEARDISTDQEHAEKFRMLEDRKKFLINKIRPFQEKISSGNRVKVFETYIDYSSAELIAQYLASKRYFSQSFDQYLKAILIVLKETSIAIRTKAMKCLASIVEADPSVLGRHDMQMGVNHSFLDHATSVREAAVDLVGKFVLSRPELISKYYEMLSARILDTGVSVRKRVIKILKDICIECPDFPKIPEICVKMIRRVNDEEGIRKLVMEVFQNMWFTPTKDSSLLRKVMNITDVVASAKDIGLEWFEQLLISLFKPKEDKDDSTKIPTEPSRTLILACTQIVDCLIENVIRLEETHNSSGSSQRLVACMTTLYLFAKIRPQLLVKHASTLQPYLSLKCQSQGDIQIVSNVARMLELVVPLMEHPSETFLAQLEEDSMKLILYHGRPVVASCLSCLGSVVNNVTRNFKLIRDCFKRFYDCLKVCKTYFENGNSGYILENVKHRQYFRRALYTVGLLLRHFDFKDPEVIGDFPPDIKDQVFQTLMYFLQQEDTDLQAYTLNAIGSICIRHYEFMLENELKTFYHRMLTSEDAPLIMKSEVLVNIEMYLIEEERRMIQQDMEWSKRSKQENLKEMGDISSGMASTVIQLYLKEILQSYLHSNLQVRQPALRVIQLILQQGLVHPVQIVPYLICMSTDCEKVVSHSADKQLLEIEKKYPGFIHTKSSLGIRLSYQLQKILQAEKIVRGFKIKEKGEYPTGLNGYLYSILRNSRQQRRALILNILKQFDEQVHTTLSYMLYLADNLAYFPYQVQDEPLFIIHHIDIMISVSGTNLLQSFREGLIMTDAQQKVIEEGQNDASTNLISALDEEDDDEVTLLARVPEDASHLQACITAAQGCLLLLMLKQHLKDVYGLSDGKIQQYSPSEPAKVYEKATNRRSNTHFNPKSTINKLKEGTPTKCLDEDGRKDLINQYLDFKQLMLKLDPDDPDDDENNKVLMALSSGNPTPAVNSLDPTTQSTILTEADQVTLANYKATTPPKVPKLIISNRRLDSDNRRTPRTHKMDKNKKHKQKKRRRKLMSSSGDESENDYSDPDFMA